MGPKNEQLSEHEFICKCCWRKQEAGVKYEITGYFCGEETFNEWSKSEVKFTVCQECFTQMTGFIDLQADEISDAILGLKSKLAPEDERSLFRFRVYVQNRIADLQKLATSIRGTLGIKNRREREEVKKDKEADKTGQEAEEK